MAWGEYLKDSEKQTAEKTVDILLAAGYLLSVFDGEETTVKNSNDRNVILGALGTTEEDYLRILGPTTGSPGIMAWVRFVWGNEDWVAICDHTTNLEAVLKPVFDWMEEQETKAEFNLLYPAKPKQ